MKLYYYDENGYYRAMSEAFLDPLETELQGKEVWLIPPHATTIEPPSSADGHIIKFNGKTWELDTLTDEQCSALNILKLELNYSTDEARAIRISQLYQEYQSELVAPTKYEVNGKTYYIDRDTDNIIKFNSAHEVAKMKGDNLFRAKNEAGEYELVTLTVGDFESILLKSALLQQSAYNRFKQARDAVNKYKRADKIFSVEF